METVFNYTESCSTFSSNERKWINKIQKLAEEYPDEVQILAGPKDNCGIIYAKVPAAWLKIAPPRKVSMSDERKAELAERMKNIRKKIAK
jgi:hypothetical protein